MKHRIRPTLGGDPEIFFATNRGAVRGAEKVLGSEDAVISAEGLGRRASIVCDGVQAELHPHPAQCRQDLSSAYACAMIKLAHMAEDASLNVSFKPVVKVSQEELKSLGESARVFGCTPSYNANHDGNVSIVSADASKYRIRTAGGHMHFGIASYGLTDSKEKITECVLALDAFVGNTCVLLDRDPLMAERRKNYGKAGEYRLPSYGLEYRTLSNFWLRHYRLMSFVYGFARQALSYCVGGEIKQLSKYVDSTKVERAINENDFDLAMEQFVNLLAFLRKEDGSTRESSEHSMIPVDGREAAFMMFVDRGLDHWFKEDPIEHWCGANRRDRSMRFQGYHFAGGGWETFLINRLYIREFLNLTEDEQNRYRKMAGA